MKPSKLLRASVSAVAMLQLAACVSTLDKIDNIGKTPPLTKVENPNQKADYQPLSWPLPEQAPPAKQYANSLWQPGARAFFRDQRANRVGDILRVNIKIQDKAELDNATDRTRTNAESVAAPALGGLAKYAGRLLPGTQNFDNLFSLNGNNATKGDGQIKRKETIETQVAALVTQKLPNGNLVISGKQEIRINFEVREIAVQGVVRPEDIRSDNTIDSTQIAEARIIYGGRGQITDIQQPRYGNQIIDALSPF